MRDLARRAIAAKLLEDAVKAEGKAAKTALAAKFDDTGADRVPVKDVDDEALGTVYRSKGSISARVTDAAALLRWVEKTYPDQVVKAIADDFQDRLLDAAKAKGVAIDPETGEVVPGIELFVGASSMTAKPSPVARERMAALLAGTDLLQLGGGS